MEFIDLKKQYNQLKEDIDIAISNVLTKANFIMGEEVRQLEKQLAEYVGVKHCISCANGTDALELALISYGIGMGDAVFVPTFTFYASAETVSAVGATPVFVDIHRDTFNIDEVDLENAIQEVLQQGRLIPKAIIAVDLFGLPYNEECVNMIAKKYNMIVIEDAAQGFGGAINGRKACSLGDIATTSFFPAKPLGCYGDGGAIFTNDDGKRELLESIKNHGKGKDKYDNIRIGKNSRLDTIQAAILLCKLNAFKEFELNRRNELREVYDYHLNGIIKTPIIPNGYISSFAQYSILFDTEDQRNKMKNFLYKKGIPTMIYYEKCMHQQTVYIANKSITRKFTNAEWISKTILNLPFHPYLEEEEVINICNLIKGFALSENIIQEY